MVECCCSCRNWDKASKKVPIDARKVVKEGEFVELSLGERSVRIRAWDWELTRPMKLDDIALRRLCFYKGVVTPWSRCNQYEPAYPEGRVRCWTEGGCEHSARCPSHKALTSYIA